MLIVDYVVNNVGIYIVRYMHLKQVLVWEILLHEKSGMGWGLAIT
jgi:hypothetical protein